MHTFSFPRLSTLALVLGIAFAGAAATSIAARAQTVPSDAVPVVIVTGQPTITSPNA